MVAEPSELFAATQAPVLGILSPLELLSSFGRSVLRLTSNSSHLIWKLSLEAKAVE